MAESLDEIHMSFGEHLEELRRRMILALLGVSLVFCITLYFGVEISTWILQPLFDAQKSNNMEIGVIGINPAAAFNTYLLVAIYAGLILASPWVVYQGWKFVEAGLHPAERRVVFMLFPFSGAMVLAGIAFFYYYMLPICLTYFLGFAHYFPNDTFKPMVNSTEYLDFVIYLALGVIVGFQLPVVMLIGGMAGILDHKFLGKYRRHAILAIFVISAILTPSDPISMLVMAAPLYSLFELGVVLIWLTNRKREREQVIDGDG